MTTKILKRLYAWIVEPNFTYYVEVWENTYEQNSFNHDMKSKKAIRVAMKK